MVPGQAPLLARYEAATGKVKWAVELPGRRRYEASPTVVDGKIYTMDFGGNVVIVDATKGEIINTIAMGEANDDNTRSSIAVARGQIFIRTTGALWAIGKPRK